jgi:Rrf2 family transcriptional regulator, iron-sulfur cluster assembly transcription factor
MMGLTRKAEYAIRGMLYLARQDEGRISMLGAIAAAVDAPRPFLAKILQSLANKGLIKSARGAGGGFALARPAAQISLCDIVEAVEGPVMPNQCLMGPDVCSLQSTCPVHPVWRRIQSVTRGILEEVTLQTLVWEKDAGKNGSNGKVPAKIRRR